MEAKNKLEGEQLPMYNVRQKEIIRYLSEVKFSKAEQLSDMFGVSVETIRRD